MKKNYENWRIEKDNSHVITLTLDKDNTSTNVLSYDVLNELKAILSEIRKCPAKALVFQSAKENSFIVGADVKEFSNLTSYNEALDAIKSGQQVMNCIEDLPFPTIALINGFCLGGGLELALACDYRIALEHEKTRLGLPEIKLGIHPGFGGTVRANRLLGVFTAMNLMLSGRLISAKKAKKIGLVDDVVPMRHFRSSAIHWLENRSHFINPISKNSMPKSKGKNQRQRPFYFSIFEFYLIRPITAFFLYRSVRQRVQKKHYPAPFKLIKLWQHYGHIGSHNDGTDYANNRDFMMQKEAESVASLLTSSTAQNLVRVFHLQNRLKALTHCIDKQKTLVQHVHIIGAGVMGGDIAIWCAYNGFTVTVHDKSNKILAQLIHRADQFLIKKVRDKRSIQAIMDRLIPDINSFGVKKADLIIEAIIEDVKVKQTVFKAMEKSAKAECIFATNTSSIPLDDISRVLDEPSRLVGIHFFNPVAKMPLVEIVNSEKTSATARQLAFSFAGKIGKLPLPVSSTPGFLVNRVLMPYLLEAIELYSEGIPAEIIDQAANDFGMPMGPIELADTVGLDICLSVANNLLNSKSDSKSDSKRVIPSLVTAVSAKESIPEILKEKVSNGSLGVKTHQGFYHYKKGKPVKKQSVYNGLSLHQISDRLMFRLFNEAVACLDEKVVENVDYLDAGIIFGTGFAPFHGGPIHYIQHKGIDTMDLTLIALSKNYGERFKPKMGWEHLTPCS